MIKAWVSNPELMKLPNLSLVHNLAPMDPPIFYLSNFLANPDEIFKQLREELAWIRHTEAPRSEYFCSDFEDPYFYKVRGGLRRYDPQPYSPAIMLMRQQLELLTASIFEVCFLNRYLNQQDWLGWHGDDSPEMDPKRPIGIISLGCERKIHFKKNEGGDITELLLEHGSLCLMAPGMQQKWMHKIPKAGFVTSMSPKSKVHFGERISATFRGFLK